MLGIVMLIQDIVSTEGREECVNCSLGAMALPVIGFLNPPEDFREIKVGPKPEEWTGDRYVLTTHPKTGILVGHTGVRITSEDVDRILNEE